MNDRMLRIKEAVTEHITNSYPVYFVIASVLVMIGACFPYFKAVYMTAIPAGLVLYVVGFAGITIRTGTEQKSIKDWYIRHKDSVKVQQTPRSGYVVDGPTTHQPTQHFGRVTLTMLVNEAKSKGQPALRLNNSDFTLAPGVIFDVVRDFCEEKGYEFKPGTRGCVIVF